MAEAVYRATPAIRAVRNGSRCGKRLDAVSIGYQFTQIVRGF